MRGANPMSARPICRSTLAEALSIGYRRGCLTCSVDGRCHLACSYSWQCHGFVCHAPDQSRDEAATSRRRRYRELEPSELRVQADAERPEARNAGVDP